MVSYESVIKRIGGAIIIKISSAGCNLLLGILLGRLLGASFTGTFYLTITIMSILSTISSLDSLGTPYPPHLRVGRDHRGLQFEQHAFFFCVYLQHGWGPGGLFVECISPVRSNDIAQMCRMNTCKCLRDAM